MKISQIKHIGVLTLLLILLFSPYVITADAHSGGKDAYGCHNCYTSYCYGEYHCHNGGTGGGGGQQFLLSKPVSPKNGTWDYKISSENWCNYDFDIKWDKPTNGDRFSISASKYTGSDPGPNTDTTSLNYSFKNLEPGRWYINIKNGNFERWGDIAYWTIDLPKPTPNLSAYISGEHMNYEISCLDTVEGPNEFINYLRSNNNQPKGQFTLNYSYPTDIVIKGWDHSGKEYTQTLSYSPPPPDEINYANTTTTSETNWTLISLGGLITFGILNGLWNKIKKK